MLLRLSNKSKELDVGNARRASPAGGANGSSNAKGKSLKDLCDVSRRSLDRIKESQGTFRVAIGLPSERNDQAFICENEVGGGQAGFRKAAQVRWGRLVSSCGSARGMESGSLR